MVGRHSYVRDILFKHAQHRPDHTTYGSYLPPVGIRG